MYKKGVCTMKQQLRYAQKDIVTASKSLSSAGLRLEGTRFHGLYRKMWAALEELNNELIKEIKK